LSTKFIFCLQTAFKIGVSYLPLALAGLEALDHWSEHLPPTVIQPYYKEILPCLDAYLKTTTDQGQCCFNAALETSIIGVWLLFHYL
jgi:hypothetical protein